MQMNNRYVQLGALTLGLAILFWLILFLVFGLLHVNLPIGLEILLAVLGAGLIVYKFFSQRVF